jgi:NitT/TauT family transport system ATP-binding protein
MLTLDSVSKIYERDRIVLDRISFTVAMGEFVAIVGQSGCGKSTLLQAIAELIPIDRGKINWDGLERPRLSFVFQESGLMPWANVWDNVSLPLRLMRKSRDRVIASTKSAIDLVGLSERKQAYPFQLSGGMKMRVSIARALVTQPQVLLMDEPFGALDDLTRTKLNTELLELSDRYGWMTIFVTHNIAEAVYLADRVLVMSASSGKITASIPIDLPKPRDRSFRLSTSHASYCQAIAHKLFESE